MRAMTKGEHLQIGLVAAVEVGDCLEWQGPFGCGKKKNTAIIKARGPKGWTENYAVAREIWEAAYGPAPDGKVVYRKCCNGRCVLLDHLTIGTRRDVKTTLKRAGLTKHHPTTIAALTLGARRRANVVNSMDKARRVRELVTHGHRTDSIAWLTGVHPDSVSDIRRGRTWREHHNGASVFSWRPA